MGWRRVKSGQPQAGFTLLELIVALAIAALVFALIIPSSLHRNAHVTLERSARDLAEALRMTRSRAVLDNRSARFMVDTDHATYRVEGARTLETLPRGMQVEIVTAAEETEGTGLGAIRFYPDGSSTGGDVALSLGQDRVDVAIDWLTGNVAIHDVARR
jgi:general secretion pathway protein H